MSKFAFIEFIGGVWVYGKAVVAYRKTDGSVQIRAETTGGKIIAPVKNMTSSEYEALRSDLYDGCFRQKADVGIRALAYMGIL